MEQSTSLSLLDRVSSGTDQESWDRLVSLYKPLLERWLRSYDVQACDVDDLIQEVLSVVLTEVSSFNHNQRVGAFRNWLRRILVNRLRNYWRSRKYVPQAKGSDSLLDQMQQLEDDTSELSRIWNEEHDQHVMARLLESVRMHFQPLTWEAFRQQVFEERSADVVAAELKMSLSSVYVARSRVLSTLRQEAAGLVDTI